jgi:5,5'-dehydrodivanillate O-demethylase oxygenase subunit
MSAFREGLRDEASPAYEDFVHTGPGTLAGRFLRRFWQPVCRAADLPAGWAKPLRIMGEDFTLYRGEGGAPHAVAFRCAHRGTQLSTGWVEGDCLRCFYHGWKYDGSGQCVEMPAEDPSFPPKIRIRSYPTEEYLGLVFAYFGEDEPPPLPRYPELEEPGLLETGTFVRPCSYFNHMELDLIHIAFVHRDSPEAESGLVGIPRVECEETEYGFVMRAWRGDRAQVQHRIMPNVSYFKVYPKDIESGWRDRVAWRVPLDDEHYVSFSVDLVHVTGNAARVYEERRAAAAAAARARTVLPVTETAQAVLAGQTRIEDVRDQVADLVFLQDEVALCGQGATPDHRYNHLQPSDTMVVLLREIWARELKALAEGRPLKAWRRPARLVAETGV